MQNFHEHIFTQLHVGCLTNVNCLYHSFNIIYRDIYILFHFIIMPSIVKRAVSLLRHQKSKFLYHMLF